MSLADRFLAAVRRADVEGDVITPFTDDLDGFGAAVEARGPELVAAITDAAARSRGTVADAAPGAFASAAVGPSGAIAAADPAFLEWIDRDELHGRMTGLDTSARPRILLVNTVTSERLLAMAVGRSRQAQSWPLSDAVRASLAADRAAFAVLAFLPREEAWRAVARALHLSPAEARLLQHLVWRGDLRASCAELGIAYDTGRKLLNAAMRRTGAAKRTELVGQALQVAGGAIPPPRDAERLLAELFDLTPRQARLAREVATGSSRDLAASSVGASQARAKADLKAVFNACGVGSAVELTRILAELDALAGLASACDVDLDLGGLSEPLRLLRRDRGGGHIAFADHGPADGKPVVVFHTTTGGRTHGPRLLAALRAAGWRPIALDRPGYGLSDPIPAEDIWDAAARDLRQVLDTLGIPRAAILGRGGAQPAIACAAALGDRIAGGVLQGPDPPPDLDRSFGSMLGRSKRLFYTNETALRAFSTLLSRRTSSDAIARMMRATVRGCAVDEAVLDDPGERRALVRGGRQSAFGLEGFIAEHRKLARGDALPVLANGANWSVVSGALDRLFDHGDADAYWRGVLPGCTMTVIPDGGRFLHATHPNALVAALARVPI